jgi:hypothetical protein
MKFSKELRDSMIDAAFKTSGLVFNQFVISFYGPATDITTVIPTLPTDLAVAGGNILLGTFTVNNDGTTPLTWEASVDGTVQRTASESVSTTCVATGYPRFCRIHLLADTGGNAADTTKLRIQGTCGTAITNDFVLDNTFYPMTATQTYSFGNLTLTFGAGS